MDEKQKDKLNFILKPIVAPAVGLAKLTKEIGESLYESIIESDTGSVFFGVFMTCLLPLVFVLPSLMFSFLILKIWIFLSVALYLSVFYIREHGKRKNK